MTALGDGPDPRVRHQRLGRNRRRSDPGQGPTRRREMRIRWTLRIFVTNLAAATGQKVEPPARGVTLPMTGIAGGLSLQTVAASLGEDALAITVRWRMLVVDVDRAVLTPERRPGWEGRLRALSGKCRARGETAAAVWACAGWLRIGPTTRRGRRFASSMGSTRHRAGLSI